MKRGRSVACGIYEAMSYAAVAADVEVHAATGQARLPKLWCARDCGHVINPNQVRAQCEGNLVLVHVIALMEQLPVAASSVTTTAFAHSPIPSPPGVPAMGVVLVDGAQPLTDARETAIVAAAVASRIPSAR